MLSDSSGLINYENRRGGAVAPAILQAIASLSDSFRLEETTSPRAKRRAQSLRMTAVRVTPDGLALAQERRIAIEARTLSESPDRRDRLARRLLRSRTNL